jgi:AcrR family transcriptional regulator
VVYQLFDSKDALLRALIAAQEHALRTRVAVALAASGATFGYAEAPFRATLRATFEFFDTDRAERFINDIETLIAAAQARSEVLAVPPRLVAYTLTALIGQIAHRRLTTDDDITAAEGADFVVSFVMKGLRPDHTTSGITEP